MLWLFVGPTGVYLLDFFCSGIQFYLLLSPYSQRASNTFNQVVEAKRFEGVFLCKKVC